MMKRYLIGIMMVVLVAMTAAADNPLRMKSGSLRLLKNSGESIYCEIDFSKTKANKKSLNEYLEDDYGSSREEFDSKIPTMEEWFSDRWDDDIKKGPRYTTNPDAPYKMVVQVKNLQLGPRSGYGGASISGYVNFYKKGESTPFAEVEILKLEGTQLRIPLPGYPGMIQIFNDLAEYLCDLIKHSK